MSGVRDKARNIIGSGNVYFSPRSRIELDVPETLQEYPLVINSFRSSSRHRTARCFKCFQVCALGHPTKEKLHCTNSSVVIEPVLLFKRFFLSIFRWILNSLPVLVRVSHERDHRIKVDDFIDCPFLFESPAFFLFCVSLKLVTYLDLTFSMISVQLSILLCI